MNIFLKLITLLQKAFINPPEPPHVFGCSGCLLLFNNMLLRVNFLTFRLPGHKASSNMRLQERINPLIWYFQSSQFQCFFFYFFFIW